MTFDELAQSWNNDLPAEHRPPTDLKQHAITTAHQTELRATILEVWTLAIFGLLGAITVTDAIRTSKSWHGYTSPLLTLGIAVFVYWCRRQRTRQLEFSGSLTDIIERGIHAVDAHIARVKAFLWWFVIPTFGVTGVGMAFDVGGRPLWVWAILPFGVAAVWLGMWMHLQSSHLPHREALKSIQQQLAHET